MSHFLYTGLSKHTVKAKKEQNGVTFLQTSVEMGANNICQYSRFSNINFWVNHTFASYS